MVGTDLNDRDDRRKSASRLAADDLSVGDYVCVLHIKGHPEGGPIMGQALQVKAICVPYFVAQLLSDPSEPTLTLDFRYLNLMRVTKEFVDAQQAGAKSQQQEEPMPMMPPRRRRKQD